MSLSFASSFRIINHIVLCLLTLEEELIRRVNKQTLEEELWLVQGRREKITFIISRNLILTEVGIYYTLKK